MELAPGEKPPSGYSASEDWVAVVLDVVKRRLDALRRLLELVLVEPEVADAVATGPQRDRQTAKLGLRVGVRLEPFDASVSVPLSGRRTVERKLPDLPS